MRDHHRSPERHGPCHRPIPALRGIQRYERDQRLRQQLDEQNRQQLERLRQQEKQPTVPQEPVVAPTDQQAQWRYSAVRLDGVTVPWKSELESLAATYLNRSISLDDLEQLRASIRDTYRRHSLLALVTINPSAGGDGLLVITVVEAHMGEVSVDGNLRHHLKNGIAEAMVRASLPKGSLFRIDKLTSALLKLNDMAGVRVRSTLRKGTGAGLTDVLLSIEDGDRSSGELHVGNEINRFLGSTNVDLTLTAANWMGRGDQLTANGQWWLNSYNTGNLVGSLAFQAPISPDGLQLNAFGNYNNYRLLDELYSSDINGYTANLRIGLQQPLWRRPMQSLWVGLSAEANTYVDKVQEVEIRNKDSQVGRLSLIAQKQDSILGTGLNTAFLQYSFGNLDRSGNSDDFLLDQFTAGTDGVFNKVLLVYSRYQVFSPVGKASCSFRPRRASTTSMVPRKCPWVTRTAFAPIPQAKPLATAASVVSWSSSTRPQANCLSWPSSMGATSGAGTTPSPGPFSRIPMGWLAPASAPTWAPPVNGWPRSSLPSPSATTPHRSTTPMPTDSTSR
ncbi:POTRA domain-containing protein [Cyanobium sp. ATX-6F1]